MVSSSDHTASRFKIGAVARLAGVSVHTIRKWEERYSAVNPQRTPGGGRLYSRDDMERLALIKKLADAGHALSDLARLPLDELLAAWRKVPGAEVIQHEPQARVRAAVLGTSVTGVLQGEHADQRSIQVLASAADLQTLQHELGGAAVDVLIFETPMLANRVDAVLHGAMDALCARYAVVVYSFASQQDIVRMQSPWVSTLRAPVDASAVERAACGLVGMHAGMGARAISPLDAEAPPPRLDAATLQRFASASTAVECECPAHLAGLLTTLRAFEDYSAECSHRSPEDAALHRYLWRCTAQARALFEDAVEHLAHTEGIPLEQE